MALAREELAAVRRSGATPLDAVVADANVLVSAALGGRRAPSVMALMRHLMDGSNWLPREAAGGRWQNVLGRRAATLSVTRRGTRYVDDLAALTEQGQ